MRGRLQWTRDEGRHHARQKSGTCAILRSCHTKRCTPSCIPQVFFGGLFGTNRDNARDEWNRLKKGIETAATGSATLMVEHGRQREAEDMWKAVNRMRTHIVQGIWSTEAERKLDGLLSFAYKALYEQDELVVLSLHNAVKECSTSLPAVSDTRATDRCFEIGTFLLTLETGTADSSHVLLTKAGNVHRRRATSNSRPGLIRLSLSLARVLLPHDGEYLGN